MGESFNRMKLRAEGAALGESFNQLKLWLEVRRRMKFQPDETLAGGGALGESFNRMKLRAEGAASDEVSTG